MICFYYRPNVYDCHAFIKGNVLTYLLTARANIAMWAHAGCSPGLHYSVDLRIQTYTEPVLLKYGKLATKYLWISGYFLQFNYTMIASVCYRLCQLWSVSELSFIRALCNVSQTAPDVWLLTRSKCCPILINPMKITITATEDHWHCVL